MPGHPPDSPCPASRNFFPHLLPAPPAGTRAPPANKMCRKAAVSSPPCRTWPPAPEKACPPSCACLPRSGMEEQAPSFPSEKEEPLPRKEKRRSTPAPSPFPSAAILLNVPENRTVPGAIPFPSRRGPPPAGKRPAPIPSPGISTRQGSMYAPLPIRAGIPEPGTSRAPHTGNAAIPAGFPSPFCRSA